MSLTKNQELLKERKRNERLLKMVKDEREKARGYEQLAEVHGAYIGILLKRLGADKENAVVIRAEDVTDALKNYETRALPGEDGAWSLYWEDKGNKE